MIIFIALLPSAIYAIPAFPGAEGWGAESKGGRGGQVIHVTNLNTSGSGSFSAAAGVSGPKIIVFDVGGVIPGGVNLNSQTTVAGQTAPGGITLQGGGLHVSSRTDVTVRHIRVRGTPAGSVDDAIRFNKCTNTIIDHCSASWTCDETIDSYHAYTTTFQWCIVAESYSACTAGSNVGRYAYIGGDVQDGQQSVLRCLFSHHYGRVPLMASYGAAYGTPLQQAFEFRNNLVYDCPSGSGYFHNDNQIPVNLVGNYYKNGNSAGYSTSTPYPNNGTPGTPVYTMWNAMEHIPVLVQDNMQHWFWVPNSCVFSNDSFPVPPTTTTTAAQARDDVLADSGAWPRDSADRRFINEVKTGTGKWAVWETDVPDPLEVASEPPIIDTDNDGMPDAWESKNGLNPNNASDHKTKMDGGYDAIEVYINELSDLYAPSTPGFSVTDHYFDTPVNPEFKVYPIPFYPNLTIQYNVKRTGRVFVGIYNLRGQEVKRIVSKTQRPGAFTVKWAGNDVLGKQVPSGTYIVRLNLDNLSYTRRAVYMK